MASTSADEKIKQAVREAYGGVARQVAGQVAGSGCCGSGRSSCCGPRKAEAETTDAAARFYSAQELGGLPDTVTEASLGCGNPITVAGLQPGEVVLDLGSGGGIDCFLAARLVGPQGRVIGLDMTPDMIRLAQNNAKKLGATNVEFRLGEMEDIPLPDASVDAVISNCVVNLSPDKDAVFQEVFRVLRPGGRLSISDIVVDGDLPAAIRDRLDAWAGCIAGALDEGVYLHKIRAAGFAEVEVLSRDHAQAEAEQAVELLAGGDGGQATAAALLAESGVPAAELSQKIASVKVRAYKPMLGQQEAT
jgi:arsenite methyltransferase